ncbi:MAG: hypothetical protein HFH85_10990 [Lachnospiraceae bacterium]|jgi:hypothetical protein|nr:hypothetical protein [Lachnospiraceae bacterium]
MDDECALCKDECNDVLAGASAVSFGLSDMAARGTDVEPIIRIEEYKLEREVYNNF